MTSLRRVPTPKVEGVLISPKQNAHGRLPVFVLLVAVILATVLMLRGWSRCCGFVLLRVKAWKASYLLVSAQALVYK